MVDPESAATGRRRARAGRVHAVDPLRNLRPDRWPTTRPAPWAHHLQGGRALLPLLLVVAATSAAAAVTAIGAHWRVGFDPARERCLPYRAYLLSKHRPGSVERGHIYYFPDHDPEAGSDVRTLVKIAAAVAGDEVRVDASGIWINGTRWGPVLTRVRWQGSNPVNGTRVRQVLGPGRVLMLGTSDRSRDGRYFGPIRETAIEGEATPIW